jgi:hypothetical protein
MSPALFRPYKPLLVAAVMVSLSLSRGPGTGGTGVAGAENLHCMFFGFPDLEYDGRDRTEPLTDRTFNKTIRAANAKSVVFFTDTEADDDEFDQYECFMQLSAQIMEKRGYKFFTVNTTQNAKLRKQEDVERGEDTIHVYKDKNQIEYFGVRDPDTFVSWLMDVPDEDLTIISDKEDRRDFEEMANTHTRLIGYFEPGSDALEEFEEAAEEFMGEVEFFAVVSKKWAKRFGLENVGEVHMYRPYEKKPIKLPKNVDTEEEFEAWVDKHKDPIMQKLSKQNYFNVWKDPEEDEFLILAFADDEEPEGRALIDLLVDLTNDNTDHAGKLEIVVIDPTEFPLMVDTWEEMFGVEIEGGPIIGYVDISEREGIWFDMDQLNLKDPQEYDEENEEVLQRWIDQILNGQISLDVSFKRLPDLLK